MNIVGFEHLHRHSDLSLLDGFGKVSEYAEYSKSVNQKYLCITDHGMMAAVPQQITNSEKHNLSPIFGCELYLQDKHSLKENMSELSPELKKEVRKSYHLLAIAFNETGFKNLIQLTSWAWDKGYYYKPRVNYEQINKHKEGIIFTSCCYNGEIGQAFDRGLEKGIEYAYEKGEEMLLFYKNMFGLNFYLEIMLLDFAKQKPYDEFIIKMHIKHKIPIITTNDCHYCKKEHSKFQTYMLMVGKKKTIDDITRHQQNEDDMDMFELQDRNLWMKSEEELNEKYLQMYSDVVPIEIFEQSKKNTVLICEKAKGIKIDREAKLPKIENEVQKFIEAVDNGMKKKGLHKVPQYVERAEEEKELIIRKGFASYFIIQKMFVDEARRKYREIAGWGTGHEAVGLGRGCLKHDTKILMANGETKLIKDVKVGDSVVHRKGTGLVDKVFCYDSDEELINIKTYYGDTKGCSLTSDHMVFCEKLIRPKNYETWAESTKNSRKTNIDPVGNLEWVPAGQINVGDWLFVPKIQLEEKEILSFDLNDWWRNDDNYYVDKDFIYQNIMNPLTKRIKKTKKSSRFIKVNEDFMKILGLFTGDGWLRSGEGYQNHIGFCFHSETDFESFEFTKSFMENLGFEVSWKKQEDKKLIQLWVLSGALFHLFDNLFFDYERTSQTKHIPSFVFFQKEQLKKSFIEGYLLSDGSDDGKIKFSTTSPRLADEVRFICSQINLPTSLSAYDRLDKRTGNQTIENVVRAPLTEGLSSRTYLFKHGFCILENGFLVKVREINKVSNETGKVYDISVPSDETFLTNSFLVHNSGAGSLCNYVLGITGVDPIKYDLLFSRFLSEARGGKMVKTRFEKAKKFNY